MGNELEKAVNEDLHLNSFGIYECASKKLFGVTLEKLLSSEKEPSSSCIPKKIEELMYDIKKKIVNEPKLGVFRIPGTFINIQRYKLNLNLGRSFLSEKYSIYDLCSLLKLFF